MRKIREPEFPFHLTWTDKFFLTNQDGSEHFEHPLRVLNKLKPYLRKNDWKKCGNSTWVKTIYEFNGESYRLSINHPDWPGEVLLQVDSIGRNNWYEASLHFNIYKLFNRFIGNKETSYNHPKFPIFWEKLQAEYVGLLATGHVFNLYGQLRKEDILLSLLLDRDLIENTDRVILSSSLPALSSKRVSDVQFKTFDVMDYLLGPSDLSNKEKAELFQKEYMPLDSLERVDDEYIVHYLSYERPVSIAILERILNGVHMPKSMFADFLYHRSGYEVVSFSKNEPGVLLRICRSIKRREYVGMPEDGFLDIEKMLGFRFIEENVNYFGRSRSGLIYLDNQDRVWGYCSLI